MTRKKEEQLLDLAAKAIDQELDAAFSAASEDAIEIPAKLHRDMLAMAREIDAARKEEHRRNRWKRQLRTVAAVLLCTTVTVGMTMGVSEGFRKKVFEIFNYEQEGAVALRTDEEEMIGTWSDYWYPTYLPDGYQIVAAEETDHFMLFQNSKRERIRLYENGEESAFSFDTDSLEKETIHIGPHEGSLFFSETGENSFAIWMTDTRTMVLQFEGLTDESEINQILEGIEYIK